MTTRWRPPGPPHIQADINALEEHYFANPAASVGEDRARRTILSTLQAALGAADQRNSAVAEAMAVVRQTQRGIDLPTAISNVVEREAVQKKTDAEEEAERYGWALKAHTFNLDDALGARNGHDAIGPLRYRLANALPGDEFNITAGGDTMTVAYDEQFDPATGNTTFTLRADTLTSHSEATFISREHMVNNAHQSVFEQGAWADRRTSANPRLESIFTHDYDYDHALAEAAKPYAPNFDDFHAEYTRLHDAAHAPVLVPPYNFVPKLQEFIDTHREALTGIRPNKSFYDAPFDTPEEVAGARSRIEATFVKQGIATYERLAAEDDAAIETARAQHRAAQNEWHDEQKKRQESTFRRLLPTSPPPTMPDVATQTTPHPFGGMTKSEWVAYETENLRSGRTDLSEFTTHRGKAPTPVERKPSRASQREYATA